MKGWGSLLGAALLVCSACSGDDDDTAEPVDACIGQTAGTACTWAGLKGFEGFNGDGKPRWQTQFNQVQDLLFHPDGTMWLTDFNNYLVRKILPDQTVQSVVGWTDPVFPGDGPLGGIPPGGGPGDDWQLNHPTNLLMHPNGNVVLVAWHNHKILEVDSDTGFVTVIAGAGAGFAGDGGPATGARFIQPNDATYDEAGNLYILDQQNQRIRMIDTDGMIDTIAGTGEPGFADGPALEAQFNWERGSNPNPSGCLVYHERKLYIADTIGNRIRVMDLDADTVATFAGTGDKGFGGDGGPAADAMLSGPRDLEIGPDGDLYFADTDNGAVRAIDLDDDTIRTVVGTGELGLDEEEQLAAEATHLRRPFGIAFDPAGDLYVMDSLNNRIVKVMR
ncbi:MAG: hypothetical protein RMA76_00290 [Deltaproteobacteria bacterium]|jgi:sugar lactone lactonase YvrE